MRQRFYESGAYVQDNKRNPLRDPIPPTPDDDETVEEATFHDQWHDPIMIASEDCPIPSRIGTFGMFLDHVKRKGQLFLKVGDRITIPNHRHETQRFVFAGTFIEINAKSGAERSLW